MDGANVELNEDNVVIQTTTNGNLLKLFPWLSHY